MTRTSRTSCGNVSVDLLLPLPLPLTPPPHLQYLPVRLGLTRFGLSPRTHAATPRAGVGTTRRESCHHRFFMNERTPSTGSRESNQWSSSCPISCSSFTSSLASPKIFGLIRLPLGQLRGAGAASFTSILTAKIEDDG